MPQLTIPVNAPVLIPNSGTAELFGLNIGVTTLYYGPDLTVSVATGTPLSPGNAIQNWPVGEPLYITSSTGPGTFSYQSNGSQIAIGATTAQVSGSVGISGGNVGVSGNVGNSNTPNQLSLTSTPFGSGAVGIPQPLTSIPLINGIGAYASLIVNVTDGSLLTLGPTSMVNITGYQMIGGFQVGPSFDAQFLLGELQGFFQIPVIGTTLNISGSYITAGGASGNIQIQIVGSNEVIPGPSYLSYNLGAAGSIANSGYFNASASTNMQYFVQSKSGPATFHILSGTGTSAGSGNVQLCEFVGPAQPILMGSGAIPTGGTVNTNLILPMRPIIVNLHPTASSLIASLLQ